MNAMNANTSTFAAVHPVQGSSGLGSLLHDLTSAYNGLTSLLGNLGGAAASGIGGLAEGIAEAFLKLVTQWTIDGAIWLLDQVGAVLSATTTVQLGSSWFGARLNLMAEVAASVMLPMLFCAVIQAIYRQSAAALLRIFLVNLPLALLFTGVAVELVRIGLALTDAMSNQFLSASGVSTKNLLHPIAGALALAPVPGFALCISAGIIAGAALILWLELTVRTMAITAAALFLPLVLGALVWPAISHWARRLADTLTALVLSKLVIVAIISLAAGAIDAGISGSGSAGVSFGDIVGGMALLFLAVVSPFVILRMIPAFEAGAVSHLESTRGRLAQPGKTAARAGAGAALEAHDKWKKKKEEEEAMSRISPAMAVVAANQQASSTGQLAGSSDIATEADVAHEASSLKPMPNRQAAGGRADTEASTSGASSASAASTVQTSQTDDPTRKPRSDA
ncbi:MAG: hypothetical protein WAM97_14890 [Acidimicrobiales bacterium]